MPGRRRPNASCVGRSSKGGASRAPTDRGGPAVRPGDSRTGLGRPARQALTRSPLARGQRLPTSWRIVRNERDGLNFEQHSTSTGGRAAGQGAGPPSWTSPAAPCSGALERPHSPAPASGRLGCLALSSQVKGLSEGGVSLFRRRGRRNRVRNGQQCTKVIFAGSPPGGLVRDSDALRRCFATSDTPVVPRPVWCAVCRLADCTMAGAISSRVVPSPAAGSTETESGPAGRVL
jgi:hypothetical protein